MWATAFAQRGPARSSLGAHGGQARLPRWQGRNRAASGPRVRRERTAAGKLGAGGRGGLARPVGDEPDADQRVDAQVSACGTIAGGERSARVLYANASDDALVCRIELRQMSQSLSETTLLCGTPDFDSGRQASCASQFDHLQLT